MLLTVFDGQASRVKAKTFVIYTLLLTANGSAWAWAWTAFAERPALLGTALLAYLFGLRHAFDADNIAAIDNVVRKLTQEGKAPCSAGFFFSLGHSTVVFVASVAIAATAAAMQRQLDAVHDLGGIVGTIVSAFFLLAIGVANFLVLRSVWSALAKVRTGRKISDEGLNAPLATRGFFAHIFRPLFRVVSRSWHMYPVGSCSASASILPRRSAFSGSLQPRHCKACRCGQFLCFRPYLPPGCRSWTRSTVC